jgi:hydrogenase nickel incorporation protein HypB
MAELITIEQKILKKNQDVAADNRAELDRHRILAIGLVSAPGSGKTSLLEALLRALSGRLRCAVVEGDVQTDLDARRIAALGVPAVQIVTNGTCHLEARMLQEALPSLPLSELDVLFVENVGNLVCPASYDLGEHLRLVLASTTEGEDKPLKYPALVMNKVDLLPHLHFDMARARSYALEVNPELRVFETSCSSGAGIEELAGFVVERARSLR